MYKDKGSVGLWSGLWRWVLVAAALVLLVTAGCSSISWANKKAPTPPASIHVAVLSVAPWERYRDAVQPTFELPPDKALEQVAPITAILENRQIDRLGTQVRLGVSDNLTANLPKWNGSGGMTNPSSGSQPTNAFTPSLGQANQLAIDSLTKYIAATALFQEVQLINGYVKDAAIDKERIAYLVRLQVSLMPRARDGNYDAYSLISFFSGPFEPASCVNLQPDAAKGIKIIPLLVTDDLEGIMASRSTERTRQLGLDLVASYQQVGGSVEVQKLKQELSALLGRELNSTFSVARVCENTLQCRFGAVQNAKNKPVMIPQTHNVTLLILMPQGLTKDNNPDARTVRLVARNWLIDPEGNESTARSWTDDAEAVRQVFRLYNFKTSPNDYLRAEMISAARTNNFPEFKRLLSQFQAQIGDPRPLTAEMLWADFVRVRNGSQYASAFFVVPQRREPKLVFDPSLTPLVTDDENVAAVTLHGGTALDESPLEAVLVLEGTHELGLHSQRLLVTNRGSRLTIHFPSLLAYQATTGSGQIPVKLSLKLYAPEAQTPLLYSNQCSYIRVPRGANGVQNDRPMPNAANPPLASDDHR